MVAALQRSGVDVVGFQELQRPQWRTFRRVAGAGYRLYSARRDTDNAIAWRRAAFSLVSARTVGVPYFGHRRPMPVVQLRHRATGQRLYVISVHNPAHRRFARARRAATRIEVRLVNRLVATGRPVVLAGDANARRRYFCRIVGGTDLKSAFGGSCGAVCRPPAYRGIDWIFGAPTTSFAGTRVRRTTIRHRVSDHPLVTSRLRFAVPVSVGR
jgi:endonuclease/exonuclease/phosphatase family metal-dependent hydrolase